MSGSLQTNSGVGLTGLTAAHPSSVQFDARRGALGDELCQGVERGLGSAVNGTKVHLVERPVHQLGDEAFDLQPANDIAERAIIREGNERTEGDRGRPEPSCPSTSRRSS